MWNRYECRARHSSSDGVDLLTSAQLQASKHTDGKQCRYISQEHQARRSLSRPFVRAPAAHRHGPRVSRMSPNGSTFSAPRKLCEHVTMLIEAQRGEGGSSPWGRRR